MSRSWTKGTWLVMYFEYHAPMEESLGADLLYGKGTICYGKPDSRPGRCCHVSVGKRLPVKLGRECLSTLRNTAVVESWMV